MKLFAFKGGVHPPDYKSLTRDAVIEELPLPSVARVPMVQHLGVPAALDVKKGDTVTTGQRIGTCHGFVSAAVHAPVTGTVSLVGDVPHPSGRMVPGVEITRDGDDTRCDSCAPLQELSSKAIVQAVQDAGIVGMGGATFPSHVKLQPPKDKPVSLLILNAAECEPFLTCDYRLMLEDGARIVRGAELIMAALGVDECIIGVEDNKPAAIAVMNELVAGRAGMHVQSLTTHYPQGGEKQLIYALTGREVPSGGLPMDVGCVVHNVGTAAAVATAIDDGMPLVERVLTVSGDAVAKPGNYLVRIGMPVQELLEFVGLDVDQCRKVVVGGPMTGTALADLRAPVIKGTSGVLALSNEWVQARAPEACIRCGRCVDVCPVGLNPTQLELLASHKDVGELTARHAVDCIECGCCSYTCPSRRPLVHGIRYGKAQIAALRKARRA
jgi:electron transport complex protein RnfC